MIRRVALVALLVLSACRGSSIGADALGKSEPATTGAKPAPAPLAKSSVGTRPGHVGESKELTPAPGNALAVFAGGCFWGTEDVFRHVPGVVATAVGYTGGRTEKPTYEDVCSHTTGHAEAVLVEHDPKKISYAELLDIFLEAHDPTQKNRQGPDVGDQYRSAIFTLDAAQADIAKKAIARAQPAHDKPIVTEVTPLGTFYLAEGYHQQYSERTGRHSCPLPAGLKKRLGMDT